MRKVLTLGSICAILILVFASLSPVVGYNNIDENNKLVKYQKIKNFVDKILDDKENLIKINQIKDKGCNCNDKSTELRWRFPAICTLLLLLFVPAFKIVIGGGSEIPLFLVLYISDSLNCLWIDLIPEEI